jgi:hypothetical protein
MSDYVLRSHNLHMQVAAAVQIAAGNCEQANPTCSVPFAPRWRTIGKLELGLHDLLTVSRRLLRNMLPTDIFCFAEKIIYVHGHVDALDQ